MSHPNTTNRVRGKRNWKATDFLTPSQRLPTRRWGGRERNYGVKGLERTRHRNPRAISRRNSQAVNTRQVGSFEAKKRIVVGKGVGKNQQKRDLLIASWEVGFRGRSIRKAQKFEKRFERAMKARQA